jgi:hypothetical protein
MTYVPCEAGEFADDARQAPHLELAQAHQQRPRHIRPCNPIRGQPLCHMAAPSCQLTATWQVGRRLVIPKLQRMNGQQTTRLVPSACRTSRPVPSARTVEAVDQDRVLGRLQHHLQQLHRLRSNGNQATVRHPGVWYVGKTAHSFHRVRRVLGQGKPLPVQGGRGGSC